MTSDPPPRTAFRPGAQGGAGPTALLPGLLVCLAITGVAMLLQAGEERVFAHPYV